MVHNRMLLRLNLNRITFFIFGHHNTAWLHLWGMASASRIKKNRLPASQATTTFTTVVGMTLTLVLIGFISVISFLGARWEKQLRQEVRMQVYFMRDLDLETLNTALAVVETDKAVAEATYIEPKDAAEKLELDLGESFVEFLGYIPLPPAMDVRLKSEFGNSGGLREIALRLENVVGVAEVVWQDELLVKIEKTINKLMVPLLSLAAICLFIALALMNNTVRLTVFARRFLIRNMQLVGARPGFIRRPFLKQGLVLGVSSGLLSFALIIFSLALVKGSIGSTALFLEIESLIYIASGLTLLGGLLGVISTALAVNRYLRLDVGRLH
jgi:cell division transport system permease protein|tara:strand:+ start:782 stop:1762 length:981 start_codon:yes stop_codon:yes gene_type:complete